MAKSETIQSTVVTEAAGQTTRVPVDVINLVWNYCHYPMSWTFKDGEWLPELTQLSFRKGLNGQGEDGDYRMPKMHAMNKGGVVIEPGNPRLGKHRGYLVTVPAFLKDTQSPGRFYCSKWETPTVLGNRTVKWRTDTVGYREFLLHLVDSGIIEPISRIAIEAKIDELSGRIDHLMSMPQNPLSDLTIERLKKDLEGMTKSLDSYEDEYQPQEIDILHEEESIVPQKMTGKPKKV